MADKKTKQKEPKVILEREYIVPLRREWIKVAPYKRANRAVKELKSFLAKHMKVYDRDLRKIKIENELNNEIRFRGMRKPLHKIKVKAIKYDNDTVRVLLVDIPEHIKFLRLREEKRRTEVKKKVEEIKKEKKPENESKDIENKEDAKEKEETSKENEQEIAKEQAKENKHVSKIENPREKDAGHSHQKVQRGR